MIYDKNKNRYFIILLGNLTSHHEQLRGRDSIQRLETNLITSWNG